MIASKSAQISQLQMIDRKVYMRYNPIFDSLLSIKTAVDQYS